MLKIKEYKKEVNFEKVKFVLINKDGLFINVKGTFSPNLEDAYLYDEIIPRSFKELTAIKVLVKENSTRSIKPL